MRKKFLHNISLAVIICSLIPILGVGCKHTYTPKPLGYHRIDFPEKEYTTYQTDCPFEFEYPVYGKIEQDFESQETCWFNIRFPEFNGVLHMSYKLVDDNLDEYTEDARKLTFKHTIKAEVIDESVFTDEVHDVYGMLFKVKGNAASAIQFYVTDSLNHFLRGSLYFNAEPNKDSLAPVIDFFTEDIVHFMETVRWE
ncbi:MAG: gliding motility lipoprotein GldD [Bacteroidota bacterium]